MTKPLVTIAGYRGDGTSLVATATKLLWNSPTSVSVPAFIAGERLDGTNGMPVTRPTLGDPLAPYVFSLVNPAAADPKFRTLLVGYDYTLGITGSSKVWLYDTVTGTWTLKPNPAGGDFFAFNPPFNFYAVGTITFNNSPFLVVADYDSAGNVGGTLALLSMTVNGSAESYATVAALAGGTDFPAKSVGGYSYQAHLQDVHVLGGTRIIAQVIYSDNNAPVASRYIKSEIREYRLVLKNGAPAFELVDTVEISKNAVHLAHFRLSDVDYMFSPCIGGYQNQGSGNGADSSISIVKLQSNGGFDHTAGFEGNGEMRALVGVPGSVAYLDFRSVAIASNGTLYFLCGNYTSSGGMTFAVYDTTASHLVTNGNTGNNTPSGKVPYTIPTDFGLPASAYIQRQTATSAFFWALAIVTGPDGSEHLLFAKGSRNSSTDTVGHDVVSFVPVGQPWILSHTIGNHADGTVINEFTGEANSYGFTINSLDISVPGGDTVRVRAAAAPDAAAKKSGGGTGTRDAEQDELRQVSEQTAATYKK
jgi:hypothetical protein